MQQFWTNLDSWANKLHPTSQTFGAHANPTIHLTGMGKSEDKYHATWKAITSCTWRLELSYVLFSHKTVCIHCIHIFSYYVLFFRKMQSNDKSKTNQNKAIGGIHIYWNMKPFYYTLVMKIWPRRHLHLIGSSKLWHTVQYCNQSTG